MEYRAILALRKDRKQTKYLIIEDCPSARTAEELIEKSHPEWVIEVLAEDHWL